MVDIELPELLVHLQLEVYVARLRVIEHVRVHGPVAGWSPGVDAEGARLQQACEASEAALHTAIDESCLAQKHVRRAVRRALRAEAALRMSDQRGTTTTSDAT